MKKALALLQSNMSVKERAEKYVPAIERDIKTDILDVLAKRKEDLEEKIDDLLDFTLDTDVNSGKNKMTQIECKDRFKKVIQLEYELTLLKYEIDIKTKSFNKYFVEEKK